MEIEPGQLHLVRAFDGERLPDPRRFSGVVITGSSAMVTDREAWSEGIVSWLPSALEAGTPLLGICYGHQLLALAVGGSVGPNPLGGEMGTVEVRLTEPATRDLLFSGIPPVIHVHASHFQSVLTPPKDAVLLASSDRDPHFAFAYGDRAWGIQFHPEFDADITSAYIDQYGDKLRGAGLDPALLLKTVRDTPYGRDVLQRFREIAQGNV
jgi:GMP synthase (glutamine-hydrolysing)